MRQVGLLTVLFLAGAAAAQPSPDAGTTELLTLQGALEMARARNRDVRAADARYLAMRERPSQEGTLPDPTVGVRYHNEDWPVTLGESEFSYLDVSAEQEIPFPGKLALRERIASREAERERAMRDLTLAMALANVAASYANLVVAERSDEILRDSLRLLALVVEQSAARYAVGQAAQQDVLRATLERGALEERLVMVARQRTAASATLKALLDLDGSERLPPTAPLPDLPPLGAFDDLLGRLTRCSPALRAAQEDVLRSQDALRLAQRAYLPDLAVMAGYTNKGRLLPEWELGVRVSVPLYFWRKQRAGVAEASFAERAAEHARRNAHVDLESRLADLHAMADSAQKLVRLYGELLIPESKLTLESARVSYAVGRVDFLTTLSAFTALLEYRLRFVEESANLLQARAEIGPLVGESPLGDPIWSTP